MCRGGIPMLEVGRCGVAEGGRYRRCCGEDRLARDGVKELRGGAYTSARGE
jgi:hypothetical protein